MKKAKKGDCADKFAHCIMNGFLVVVAIIWFFWLAYIYLSWIIIPVFFNIANPSLNEIV
jgi:hypothetical protein